MGGIVVSSTPAEPVATEPAGPTEEPDNKSIAPAVVVVVLRTSDGGVVSDRTTVCVSEVCQPVGAAASGTKIEFGRIVQGWHEISVTNAGAYEDGRSSVAVRPGQLHTVVVTLAITRQVDETPSISPPGTTAPIRSPIQAVEQDDVAGRDVRARAASPSSGDDTAMRVRALPVTGTGQPIRFTASAMLVLGAAAMLTLAAAGARCHVSGYGCRGRG